MENENLPDAKYKKGGNGWLRVDGVAKTYAQWEQELGLSAGAVSKRIHLGWPLKDCVKPKVQPKNGPRKRPEPVVIPPRESEQMSSLRHGAWV